MNNSSWSTLPLRLWHALREVTGDNAYERYLEHQRRCHPQHAALDRTSFYLSEQERRFNGGPNRCC